MGSVHCSKSSKILIPIGKTMIVVAHVKYAPVSTYIPTVVTSLL